MIPRKKRQRYRVEAEKTAARLGLEKPKDWNEIWALLDEHGTEQKPTKLYVIADCPTGTVKIGRSNWPSRRLHALQTGSGRKLVLWGYCAERSPLTEKEVHAKLREFRLYGEWFRLTPEVQDTINAIRNASRGGDK